MGLRHRHPLCYVACRHNRASLLPEAIRRSAQGKVMSSIPCRRARHNDSGDRKCVLQREYCANLRQSTGDAAMKRSPFELISALRRSCRNWMAVIPFFAFTKRGRLRSELIEPDVSVLMTREDFLILAHLLNSGFNVAGADDATVTLANGRIRVKCRLGSEFDIIRPNFADMGYLKSGL